MSDIIVPTEVDPATGPATDPAGTDPAGTDPAGTDPADERRINETRRRLTFAIISHPDAGKTTITEKLLLFGGAIRTAGAVKSGKTSKTTVSDSMSMEIERGISISTSVMSFDYRDRRFNLLDTPGHADFSEDTYRVLTAVDSSLMMIDSVKGVEERTRSLCKVCSMRATPIITFMNKMDREGRDPVELLDEVERELGVEVRPMTWPVGQGRAFKGVYDLYSNRLILFRANLTHHDSESVTISGTDDPLLAKTIGDHAAERLREEVAMIQGVYPAFDIDEYRAGTVTPVFFGSALNNFGVRELLDRFVDLAPSPTPKPTETGEVDPLKQAFNGFIFKIHANLDPRHRDRMAFLRVVSGVFRRNTFYTLSRTAKKWRTATPTFFMAQDRTVVEEAYPGDIVGLHDTGLFKIGDSLCEAEPQVFRGIPSFAPQIFRQVYNGDPLKSKQFHKGLQQLAEEGVVQLFTRYSDRATRLLGVVGQLQLDVIQYRLVDEYGAQCRFDATEFTVCSWVGSPDKKALAAFLNRYAARIALDVRDKPVFLADTRWYIDRIRETNPAIRFYATSDGEDLDRDL